jgi:hypothetical protein
MLGEERHASFPDSRHGANAISDTTTNPLFPTVSHFEPYRIRAILGYPPTRMTFSTHILCPSFWRTNQNGKFDRKCDFSIEPVFQNGIQAKAIGSRKASSEAYDS